MCSTKSIVASAIVVLVFVVSGFVYQHESRIQSLARKVDTLAAQLASTEGGSCINDTALACCKDVADHVVQKWSKDSVALQDFALARSGAIVIPFLMHPKTTSHRLGLFKHSPSWNSPQRALEADLQPGGCWRFGGGQGYIGITLPIPTVISHITIDHIPKELTLDMGSAPRSMVFWGFVENAENFARYSRSQFHPSITLPPQAAEIAAKAKAQDSKTFFLELARFDYDITQSESYIQTFPIYKDVQDSEIDFGAVLLEIRSNWGAEFTCLYRMRVHGYSRSRWTSKIVVV